MHHDDSETDDSDLESSMVTWLNLSSSVPTSSTSNTDSNLYEAFTKAIRFLKNARLADIAANVEDLHRKILEASNTINTYLDGIITGRPDALEQVQLFAFLVSPCFLVLIFAQRRIFHSLAVKALAPGTMASTVVCWVDGLIAKLGGVTVILACGPSADRTVHGAMKTQLEDDGLRAAAQLPEKWNMVPAVITSANASPAAKRLAIQLTFAVYIIGPRLQKYNPWNDDQNTPGATDISKILDQYVLTNSDTDSMYTTQKHISHMRLSFAMIISLYAVSNSELHRNQPTSPFQPRTLSGLLDMIQTVLASNVVQEDESLAHITPHEPLDKAQVLLLQWGNTLPWCWETWNDYRVAKTECITQLTATWLYHLQVSDVASYQAIPNAYNVLEKNPASADLAIVQILHHSMTVLLASGQAASLQKMFFVVLFNSCCAANHLLRHELVHARTLHRAESSVKYLLGLFVLLVLEAGLNRRPDLNSTILESLTLVDDRTFTEALTQVCEDRKIRFVERMDEMILRTRRYLIHSVEPGNNLSNTEAEELRLVLYFVIRIWHNAEGQKRIQRQPILNLLSSLINRLSKKDIEPLSLTYLRDAAVTAFSVLDTDSTAPIKNPKQDDIWKFALDSGSSNLSLTGSFAHHIMATGSLLDPLNCVEAWDHLRDALTLILRCNFVEDQKPVALLVSLGICGALIRLLDSDSLTVQFVLNSPWTMSFCVELRRILRNQGGTENDYCRLLISQLAPVGDILLDAIHSKVNHGEATSVKERIPNLKSRLVYHGRYPHYNLVLVHNTSE